MDTISILPTKENFRVIIAKNGRLILIPIKKEESAFKLCKIIGKTANKNKKLQLNLHDGNNKLVDKDDYSVGDTIVISLPKKEIKEHLKLENGAIVYITNGSYVGEIGKLEEVKNFKGIQPSHITFKTKDKTLETLAKYVFVIGKDKQLIELPKDE